MRKPSVLIVAALVGLAGLVQAAPSQAATTTTVHLHVDVAGAAPMADCDVTVPTGANGIAVLSAAKATGCIDGYTTRNHPQFGVQVTCIEQVCQAPDEALNLTYWGIYLGDDYASTGVSGLSFPRDGRDLGFRYETWATYLVPTV